MHTIVNQIHVAGRCTQLQGTHLTADCVTTKTYLGIFVCGYTFIITSNCWFIKKMADKCWSMKHPLSKAFLKSFCISLPDACACDKSKSEVGSVADVV